MRCSEGVLSRHSVTRTEGHGTLAGGTGGRGFVVYMRCNHRSETVQACATYLLFIVTSHMANAGRITP